jgi:DNA-binding XRE family transcriptional regulator
MLEMLPEPISGAMEMVYERVKVIHPTLTEGAFLGYVAASWLEPYQRRRPKVTRGGAVLRNNLAAALKASGRTQTKVAEEVGVSRPYLWRLINGECEPTIKIAFLLAQALRYPPERICDLFYLEEV